MGSRVHAFGTWQGAEYHEKPQTTLTSCYCASNHGLAEGADFRFFARLKGFGWRRLRGAGTLCDHLESCLLGNDQILCGNVASTDYVVTPLKLSSEKRYNSYEDPDHP